MNKDAITTWVRYILLILFVGFSTNLMAQISTTTYNDREVKENSIVVVYEDGSYSLKSKSVSPKLLAADVQQVIGATKGQVIPNQSAEEWIISGDMGQALSKLNALPGVRAFPNYVFHRDKMDPEFLSDQDQPFILDEMTNAVDRKKVQNKLSKLSISMADMESFSAIPLVYEEYFNDTTAVDTSWTFVDWMGSGVYWELAADGNGGFMPRVANESDSTVDIAADLYSPGIDMSGLDSTKSYRLKFDISNSYYTDTFIGLYYDSENTDSGLLDISGYDNWGWWDISRFVGDTLYIDFYVESYGVPAGQTLVSIDNVVIEEYPVDDALIELQYALYNDGLFNPGYSVPGADISAFDAWETTTGSSDAVVVVYDDGVDFDHPDLINNAWVNPGEVPGDGVDNDGNGYVDDIHGWSSVYNNNWYLNPGSFHGTHVAGIIGAEGNNGIGVSGVAQDVSIISVMIFNEYGGTDAISIMAGYAYVSSLLEQGVDIVAVNQSWGGGAYLDYESDQQFVSVMTDFAWDHASYGTAWVVSAGNDASNRDELGFYSYPNNIQSPNIINVASTDDAENLSGFSDYGVRTVDIGAPGTFIASTYPNNSYVYMSGTSMAAPHVTGALALGKAQNPDDTGMDLMVRSLAGADILSQYQGMFGEGGRLNANEIVNPSASGLLASHGTASFHRTFIDGAGYTAIGFVNNSGASVDVTGVTISGTNADNFFTPEGFTTVTVPAGGAYSVPIGFDNAGVSGEFIATATIETSGDNVSIGLNGREQGFASTSVDPPYAEFTVPHGSEINTSFTITNDGTQDSYFYLQQMLYFWDYETTEEMAQVINFESSDLIVEKSSLISDKKEMLKDARFMMEQSRDEIDVPTIKAFTDPNTELIFADDFNNADSTNAWWDIQNYGGNTSWEVTPTDETNNILLWGDFDTGYLDNSIAVAWSPIFDLSGLGMDRYAYIMVDMAAEMENCCDDFWIDAWVGGQGGQVVNLVATWFEPELKDGNYRTLFLDLSQFSGVDSLQFAIAAESDGSVVGGFGAMVDNFYLLAEDVPFYTSITDGVIAPGGSQEVDITVKTGLLPPGEFELATVVFPNDPFSFYDPFLPAHILSVDSRNVNLEIDPQFQYLGEVSRDEPLTYTFDANNMGAVAVDYYASTGFTFYNPTSWWSGGEDPFGNSRDAALNRFEEEHDKEPLSFDLQDQKNFILSKKADANLGSASSFDNESGLTPSRQADVNYFEDFEGGVVPDGWDILDGSYGLGSNWDVENLGTEEDPYHTLFAGEYDGETSYSYIRDNSYALAFSPYIDVSEVPSSENLVLGFDYSFLMEPGYDFASVWYGYTQDGVEYLNYLGSSDDMFNNDGGEYRSYFEFQGLSEDDTFYIAVLVETDIAVQSGWAYVDDIEVYTYEKLSYVDSEFGTIDIAGSQQFEVTVNTPWLQPGEYEVATFIDYYGFNTDYEQWIGRAETQYTFFELPNSAPMAGDDEIAVLAGEEVYIEDILDLMLSNDSDAETAVWLHEAQDPLYGKFRYTGADNWGSYVAPLNYDGYDEFTYVITDGSQTDTATVFISVAADPHFPVGSDKQYVFLEDESLTLGTIGMAAGVGGMDVDLIVWGESGNENISVDHDAANHTITLSATEDFFGQASVSLHVGYEGSDPMDSMDLSVVVTPVNDAPVAEFEAEANQSTVTFADMSSDPKDAADGGIVQWDWNFGDGETSEERNPVHIYDETGTYEVTLTVTDNGGLTNTFTSEVTVTLTTSTEDMEIPLEFAMEQNYPNPFNPNTIINYSIPEASKVSIVIYDLLGKKVAELVNSQKSAGKYSVNFDASNLTSGIYIYQIRAGNFTNTKKMTLIK